MGNRIITYTPSENGKPRGRLAEKLDGRIDPSRFRIAPRTPQEGLQFIFGRLTPFPAHLSSTYQAYDEKTLDLTPLSEVEAKRMTWLWDKRIPMRGPTILAGEGDVGKTFLAIDFSSRVSRGKHFPDGSPCEPGYVLFFSAEDDPETVLRPRFEAHGADCQKIIIQSPDTERLLNLASKQNEGLKLLEQSIRSVPGPVRLIVFDPLTAFISGKDINRDDEVRSIFSPLKSIAGRHDLAILCIMHFGKSTEVKAKYRSLGSVGFVNAARAAWAVGKEYDEDELVHFVQTKKNYSKKIKGLSYTLRDHDNTAVVHWEGETEIEAGDLGIGSRAKHLAKIAEWVEDFCTKHKCKSVTDANLQQSGLPGTKGNANYCRELLTQLEKAGKGKVEQESRKRLRYWPGGKANPKNPPKKSKGIKTLKTLKTRRPN